MLARSFRLQKKDINRLYKKGKVLRLDSFLVRVIPSYAGHCRFSVVISKKVLALAVDRNRAKRLIYEYLQTHQELWKDKNLDVAFFPKVYDEQSSILTLNKILSKLQ